MPRVRKSNVVRMPKPDADAPRVAPRPAMRYEAIARRAYEIFERRGAGHGADVDDWLQAERELRQDAADKRPA